MKKKNNEVVINGITYVPKGEEMAKPNTEGMEYRIIRSYSAGVFAGYVKHREGKEVELVNARRIWYWDGANSLSDLATIGVTKPENCKFCTPINVIITEAIEIIEVTEKAKKCIESVKEWTLKDDDGDDE